MMEQKRNLKIGDTFEKLNLTWTIFDITEKGYVCLASKLPKNMKFGDNNDWKKSDLRAYLKWCLDGIREMVSSLGLSLNGKTQIVPFKCGIGFTGFHHYMTSDGKYIRKLKGENKRRMRKKIRTWAKLVKSGRMSKKKFYEKYNAWKNHALHGNCIKLCYSMDLFVKELLESEE